MTEIYAVQCFSELTFRLAIMLVLIFLTAVSKGTQNGRCYFTCQFTLVYKIKEMFKCTEIVDCSVLSLTPLKKISST